jgi:Holliday junction resolvase RusA-like endonuclease
VKDYEQKMLLFLPNRGETITKPCRFVASFNFIDNRKYLVSDLDNLFKLTLDLLQKAKFIKNDNLVVEIIAKKTLSNVESVVGYVEEV